MKTNTKITSAGIIRNADKPRVGVLSQDSLVDWAWDEIYAQGIDLSYEEFLIELREQGIEEESERWYKATDSYQSDESTFLFGNAWVKNSKGKYVIDTTKEFAAMIASSGNVTVEFSKYTARCHHTSPCYVMMDGSGPCGDLDTEGDSVIAYTLPASWIRGKE
jgi:hypothetical protein